MSISCPAFIIQRFVIPCLTLGLGLGLVPPCLLLGLGLGLVIPCVTLGFGLGLVIPCLPLGLGLGLFLISSRTNSFALFRGLALQRLCA